MLKPAVLGREIATVSRPILTHEHCLRHPDAEIITCVRGRPDGGFPDGPEWTCEGLDTKGMMSMKTTAYFDATRNRPDRVVIRDAWIRRVLQYPEKEHRQMDGRIRRWARIAEMENRYLRVVLLPDGETVHNAFFDRGFKP